MGRLNAVAVLDSTRVSLLSAFAKLFAWAGMAEAGRQGGSFRDNSFFLLRTHFLTKLLMVFEHMFEHTSSTMLLYFLSISSNLSLLKNDPMQN